MLQRLYVHNFRSLDNFELTLKGLSSALLIGKNGVGKSTIAKALEVLQNIGRGINRMRVLEDNKVVSSKDFTRGRSDVPIRFEVEVLLKEKLYKYALALDLPENFKELRVCEEYLSVDGNPVYSRDKAKVTIGSRVRGVNSEPREVQFSLDWHLAALPVIQEQSEDDPIHLFKIWLARMIILAPIPDFMTGKSIGETLEPKRNGSNFGEWFSGLLSRYPAAYTLVYEFLRQVMPDKLSRI